MYEYMLVSLNPFILSAEKFHPIWACNSG